MKRAAILTTVAFVVALGILIADFMDNGHIDNDNFLIVALFVFSGAGTGRAVDALVDNYLGRRRRDDDQ